MTISTWFDTDTFEGGMYGKKRASSRKEKKNSCIVLFEAQTSEHRVAAQANS
jgi:hypothetical protein